MQILVTGGCGFIGSNYIRCLLQDHPEDTVVNLDQLTYAGNLENLKDVEADYGGRYRFIKGDICDADVVTPLVDQADAVMHFAAESHVDRSITDAQAFVRTNVLGSQVMLEAAHRSWGDDQKRRFVYVSTDEVYGALTLDDPQGFRETTPLDPRSPYSASKAAGDMLASAYHHTHGLNLGITRCCNNYGPFQFPEKLVPLMILNTQAGKELPIYGDGLYVRDWIYVEDNCRATDLVLRKGKPGKAYNIGARSEQANIELVKTIISLVAGRTGKNTDELMGLMRHVKDRPGHDRRYAIDPAKLQTELGFKPQVSLERGMGKTVNWYLDNPGWCERITSGAYQEYYREMYGQR